MTVYGLGQDLNVFFTELGNRAGLANLYVLVGAAIFVGSVAHLIRKQIRGRKFLYGAMAVVVCVFVNPVWFLPYAEFYQTVFLLLMVPVALVELRWKKLLTVADFALFNVPVWHWSLIYWAGTLNAG